MIKKIFLTMTLCFLQANVLFGGTVNIETVNATIQQLNNQHGEQYTSRIKKGVTQVAKLWQNVDGSSEDFKSFCNTNFITNEKELFDTFLRFDKNLEAIYGHNLEINRTLSGPIQLEIGDVLPVDYLFAEYDPYAHIRDDLFKTKIAFVALLNFPVYTLKERLSLGEKWDRNQWAFTRLAQQFTRRIPAEANQELTKAYVQADDYIANYNVYMHNLLDENGDRLFPKGLKLITHWGLRDELKGQYANSNGLEKQQLIYQVMLRIVKQEIPAKTINSDKVDWAPVSNDVFQNNKKIKSVSENDERYSQLLAVFKAEKQLDPYTPLLPTKIQRRFDGDREIPEQEFEALISAVLKDPVIKDVAALIESRLGRKLQPFDIWYNGFKPRSTINEQMLDEIVTQKYPTVKAFKSDLENILSDLGFTKERALYLSKKIEVDPSRGAGHAMGAARRDDNAHLRTRIPKGGMKYKGYNIAIHELGHNVEQVLSLNKIDFVVLNGVPNTAFTEALAFVFQSRDMELLGQAQSGPLAEHLKALDVYWSTCEIAAVGLVDMRVWHWMYENPDATPKELKRAVINIAKDVWNEYFASVFNTSDNIILGIYSHMISNGLYLPDYSLGHIIMFQIEEFFKGKNLGSEMERICTVGSITPDAWMKAAVGSPISAQPLIDAAKEALKAVQN
jgi:hypothetical protein